MRTVTPVRILFADEFRFLQILYSSADCTRRKRQLSCYGFDAWPTLFLFVTSVIEINVDRLCPVRKVMVFIKFSVIRHLLTSICPHRNALLQFFGTVFFCFYRFVNLTFCADGCVRLVHIIGITCL